MKKISILLGAAAVLLSTSCSNDEVVSIPPTQGIGFKAFVDKSTRATDATDISNSTLKNFQVWGATWNAETQATPTSVFLGQQVDLSNNEWSYAPLRYWVIGNNYRFTAIAPANATGLTATQNIDAIQSFEDVQGGLELTFDNSAAKAAVDLCYAQNKVANVEETQGKVQMTFGHMLSRVKFTFENGFASENTMIRMSNIKITNATSKGTINKVKGETLWTAVEDANGTFTIDFINLNATGTPLKGGEKAATEHQYILPLTTAMVYKADFTVTLYNWDSTLDDGKGDYKVVATYNHTGVELPSIEYKNNYSYNFVANINAETIDPEHTLKPIEFTANVTPWEDFGDNDVTIKDPNAEVTE